MGGSEVEPWWIRTKIRFYKHDPVLTVNVFFTSFSCFILRNGSSSGFRSEIRCIFHYYNWIKELLNKNFRYESRPRTAIWDNFLLCPCSLRSIQISAINSDFANK